MSNAIREKQSASAGGRFVILLVGALCSSRPVADAKPLANELVAVQMPDGSVRRVFSNAQGVYRVFDVPHGTVVKVGLRGREQAITLKNMPSTLHVQLPKLTAPHPTKSH